MERVLGLDLSSKAGWAVLEDGKLTEKGLIQLDRPILGFDGGYPWNFHRAAGWQAQNIEDLAKRVDPTTVVIEETNLGKNRYSQKFLEFLHCRLLLMPTICSRKVVYLSSSAWRSALGLQMTAEDRRNNGKLSRAKKHAFMTGGKLDKASLGIKGRVNKKHLAVRYANATYNLNLKMKDNDIADAICLAAAYLAGADACDGQ